MDGEASWHDIVLNVLKRHDVRLVTYVPDNVLRPLIEGVHADPFFTAFATTREEEAVGIVAGAWMGGMRGIVLMQTSGFATLAERRSLRWPVPLPDPGADDGERARHAGRVQHRPGAGGARPCARCWIRWRWSTTRMTRLDEVEFVIDRSIRQAVATQAPVTFILSPLLTGGKVFQA